MLARALIVLLVVLNLGVAAWWLSGPEAPVEATVAPPSGVPRLQLLSESPAASRPAPAPAALSASAPTAASDADAAAAETIAADKAAADKAALDKTAVDKAEADRLAALAAAGALPADARCLAIGPFVPGAAADAARALLQPRALRVSERTVVPGSSRGWRVWLPPLADREAAQAMAARITAAGFPDLFVLNSGDDTNGIALGRFGSEPSARQREAALHAAGFADVRAAAVDPQPPQRWIDVAIAAGGPGAAELRGLASAAQANTVTCATLR